MAKQYQIGLTKGCLNKEEYIMWSNNIIAARQDDFIQIASCI
ncbi:hypothetical protein yinte0001_11420 [Yersinia intermedia ATCC 29909]|nr:hypothetical protein yinte0001_11420 [Yersinia intermedia ATCC 29909]